MTIEYIHKKEYDKGMRRTTLTVECVHKVRSSTIVWDYELEDRPDIIEHTFDKLDKASHESLGHYYED